MKRLPLTPITRFLTRFRTPIIWGGMVIVFILLFTVGGQYEWTGVGEDKTVTTSVRTDATGNVERTETTIPQSGKTLWDILSLIGVPVSLAVFGWWLQQLQEQRSEKQARQEKAIAQSNQNEEALQGFIDRISELLIKERLMAIATKIKVAEEQDRQNKGKVEPDSPQPDAPTEAVVDKDGSAEVKPASAGVVTEAPKVVVTDEERELYAAAKDVIQARTSSILRRLGDDLERKSAVIRFLPDADVVEKVGLDLSGFDLKEIYLLGANLTGIRLSNAQLEGADLSFANLRGAALFNTDLSSANLSDANLSSANLSSANLSSANLIDANLSDANLSNADLRHANLSFADFRNAILISTDLRHAKGLIREQLEGDSPPFLCNVAGITDIDPNRDCNKLPQVLHELYSSPYPEVLHILYSNLYPEFETLEGAKAYVDKVRQKNWD